MVQGLVSVWRGVDNLVNVTAEVLQQAAGRPDSRGYLRFEYSIQANEVIDGRDGYFHESLDERDVLGWFGPSLGTSSSLG